MNYVLIIHEVDDYLKWKLGFDNTSALRKAAGELAYQVLQYTDDKNQVVHYSKWQSHAEARAFFESDEVQEIREKLGVKKPTFIYLNQMESCTL